MPTYSFRNNDTGEEFTELMSISEREKFLEQNPNIQQLPSMFSMVGGTGDRIKNDDGWKERGAPLWYTNMTQNQNGTMIGCYGS